MSKAEFRGRTTELQLLDYLWELPTSTLLILYGRRRVGKTRLLTHWLGQVPERSIYWVAEPTSAYDQLRSFSQTIYNFAHPDAPAPLEFTYANWEQALQQLARLSENGRIAIFIDEVTYLIDVDPAIMGTLQKMWDHTLSSADLFIALSGSQMGLMQREMLSYQAPLYGRATAQIQLPPLPFDVTSKFFPAYNTAERVALYAIFGGIPAYWERLDKKASVIENVRTQLLTSNTLMQEEPRLLLQDFISDPHNYVSILRAIAHGSQTQSEIGKRTGLSQGHVSKYLGVLRDTGFVERRVPVTEVSEKSRRGRYYVTDPYLRFYYRFLASYQAQLALGAQQKAQDAVMANLPEFIEKNTWVELCQEWLLQAGMHGELPFEPEKIGGQWTRSQEAAVAAINYPERQIILGDCFWRDQPLDRVVIDELVRKTVYLVPKEDEWTVHYISFAAHGWDDDAQETAEALIDSANRNWVVGSVQLLDLQAVDEGLTHWAIDNTSSAVPTMATQPRLF
ncbi:MAG: ATP-binding protein [Anaerolineales bacterium]|nr:ATP-binding protein [Anaerolineales bacterium]